MKRLLVSIVFALSIALPVMAQDETPVVTETATAEVTPVVEPTLAPTEPAPEPEPDFDGTSAAELLLYVGLAVVAGGGLLAILYRLLESRDVRDRVEKAYESWSPDQREFLLSLIEKYEETNKRLLEFAKAVTDGKANG